MDSNNKQHRSSKNKNSSKTITISSEEVELDDRLQELDGC